MAVNDEYMDLPRQVPIMDLVRPETVINIESSSAKLMEAAGLRRGCFKFNNNGTENWTIDQIFDTATNVYYKPLLWGGIFYGFELANNQNLALKASAKHGVVIPASNIMSCYILLESPDLTSNPDWQNISGYSLDVYRTLTAPCGDKNYCVQLIMDVLDGNNAVKHFGESKDGKFICHPIQLNTPYHLTWKFKMEKAYKVKCVRIKLIMPYIAPGQGECSQAKGEWLIGNVCPERKS
jgi:hypothetical protein